MTREEVLKHLALARKTGKKPNLSNANLQYVNLSDIDFTDVAFCSAKLNGAKLNGSVLHKADFSNADLVNAEMNQVDARETDFRYADLTGVDFAGADLRGADFDYSVWPLWCGTRGVMVDVNLAAQLAAHFCALICHDEAYEAACNAILDFAKTSHIAHHLEL